MVMVRGCVKKITFFLHKGGFVLRIQQKFNKDNCILGAIWGQNPAPKCEIGDIFCILSPIFVVSGKKYVLKGVFLELQGEVVIFVEKISCGYER